MIDENMNTYVHEVHDKYRELMGLKNWEGRIFVDSIPHKTDDEDGAVAGTMKVDTNYLGYKLTLYPVFTEAFKNNDLEFCERTIVHELSHLFTEPLYDIAIDHCPPAQNKFVEKEREQLTELLSRCFIKINKHGGSK